MITAKQAKAVADVICDQFQKEDLEKVKLKLEVIYDYIEAAAREGRYEVSVAFNLTPKMEEYIRVNLQPKGFIVVFDDCKPRKESLNPANRMVLVKW